MPTRLLALLALSAPALAAPQACDVAGLDNPFSQTVYGLAEWNGHHYDGGWFHLRRRPVAGGSWQTFGGGISGSGGFTLAGPMLPFGDDLIVGGGGRDRIVGGVGDDELRGKGGRDVLIGGAGDDELKGGRGADRLVGDSGRDALFGGGGADRLFAGHGNDVLTGGRGDDTMEGGAGADRFVFDVAHGRDVILDFQVVSDRIDFRLRDDIDDIDDLLISQIGSRTVISDGDGGKIILRDVDAADIDASDFLF